MGEECEINPRRSKDLKANDNKDTSFVPMEAVDGDRGIISGIRIVPFSKVKKGYTYFEENDVLFAKITPCMQNKKSAVAEGLISGYGFGTTEFHVLRCKEKIIPKWVYYFIRNQRFIDEAENNFTGAVGQQRVPASFLENYPITVPPVVEQQKIVDKLNNQMAQIEKMKKEAKEQMKAADNYYRSYLLKVFSEKDNWQYKKFGELFNTKYGLSKPSVRDSTKTKALRMTNISYEGELNLDDICYLDLSDDELKQHRLKKNDLIFNRTNSADLVGKTTVFDQEDIFVAVSYLVVATPKTPEINSKFISYYLNTSEMKKYFVENCDKAISQANFSASKLCEIQISVPEKKTQDKIVALIQIAKTELMKVSEPIKSQLDAINQLPASILNEVFEQYQINS